MSDDNFNLMNADLEGLVAQLGEAESVLSIMRNLSALLEMLLSQTNDDGNPCIAVLSTEEVGDVVRDLLLLVMAYNDTVGKFNQVTMGIFGMPADEVIKKIREAERTGEAVIELGGSSQLHVGEVYSADSDIPDHDIEHLLSQVDFSEPN